MIGTIALGAGMKTFCGFIFDNPIGKAVAGGVLVVGVFMTWLYFHDANVRNDAVADINASAKELAHEAEKARAPAARPGAADRLRKHSCRDC